MTLFSKEAPFMINTRRHLLLGLFVIGLFSSVLISACSGQTVIDVNIDPTTGSGSIVVNPPPTQQQLPETGGSAQPATDMSQVALFAIVVILLMGVMAIVVSVARRPRRGE
jgi:hypothetical protein